MCQPNEVKCMSKFAKRTSGPRRLARRTLMQREYANLKSVIPSLAVRRAVTKLDLINEAVRYIDQLEEQVMFKLMQRKLMQANAARAQSQISLTTVQPIATPIDESMSVSSVDINNNRIVPVVLPTTTASLPATGRSVLQPRQINVSANQ